MTDIKKTSGHRRTGRKKNRGAKINLPDLFPLYPTCQKHFSVDGGGGGGGDVYTTNRSFIGQ